MKPKILKLLVESRDVIHSLMKIEILYPQGQLTLNNLNEVITKELSGKMHELGERNYALIVQGIKNAGTYDPNKIFFYFEEQLYVNEADQIWDFLEWVNEDKLRGFGNKTYEQRFTEFLNK